MAFFDSYDISTSGMRAQRTRINVISANIANAQTTKTQDGGPYQRQQVIFQEVLDSVINKDKSKVNSKYKYSNPTDTISGVRVYSIKPDESPGIKKYEPGHPDADKDGYVLYPNVNPVIEMTNLIEATRSYEANLASFKTQKTIDTKTIELLK
jgi:flagellar basal-body rod protein FlgC